MSKLYCWNNQKYKLGQIGRVKVHAHEIDVNGGEYVIVPKAHEIHGECG